MRNGILSEEEAVALLAALGVEEIRFSLDGGGDSGDCDVEEIVWRETHPDGRPVFPVQLDDVPHLHGSLLSHVLSSVSEWPEGDWVNNEGGYGSVTIRPFAAEPVEIDMTYREEGDDGEEDFDGEEDLAEDLEIGAGQGAEAAPSPFRIEDGHARGFSLTVEDAPPEAAPLPGARR